MEDSLQMFLDLGKDIKTFFLELGNFVLKSLHISFLRFEERKGIFVTALYRERGKKSRQLTHYGMAGITALGVIMAPLISQEFPGKSVNPWEISAAPTVLSASTDDPGMDTQSSNVRDVIIDYQVQEGDKMGKKEIMQLIKRMPEKTSAEDILYEIFVRMKIDKGLKQLDSGRGFSHEQAKQKLSKWLQR